LFQKIQEFRPQVIHIHNFFYLASPAIFEAAKKLNIPVVLTLHNYRTVCANALLLRDSQPCERCISKLFPIDGIKYACFQDSSAKTAILTTMLVWHKWRNTWTQTVDKMIVLSDFAFQKFTNSSLKPKANQLVVKANSVDDYNSLSFDERADYFLFVGRLSQEKGIQVLLDAVAHTSYKIVMIGDGPLRGLVESYAQQYPHLQYAGPQAHEEVMVQIQKSKALVVPSVCYEGLPTTVLEAYATGTPVVISDIDNLNQLVTNQLNGLTFQTGNGKDLAAKLSGLYQNTDLWLHLASQARKTYEQSYTHAHNYEQLLRIYEEVIAI